MSLFPTFFLFQHFLILYLILYLILSLILFLVLYFRALCTRHIGDWLPLDPSRLFKDDYLKYIGWMCFDYSNTVRKEAVRSVGKLLKVRLYLIFVISIQRPNDLVT